MLPLARFDLHLHTEFSPDCDTGLEHIEAHCLARGLTGIAVTDHNTLEGAQRLRDRVTALQVIVGEEVSTREGDVIGLFLEQHIPARMSAVETMQAIHEQEGLVYLPHPFDKAHTRRSGGAALAAVIDHVDIVETYNGKVGHDNYNLLAADFAKKHAKVAAGGSDAHSLKAIGTVTNTFELDKEFTPTQFLKALSTAHIVGRRRSKFGGIVIIGRRPFSIAWRRLRAQIR